MSEVHLPPGFRWESLAKGHPRKQFSCGQAQVDSWLQTRAFQHQEKKLSVTKVLLNAKNEIAGFYTLAMGQVDFNELPVEIARRLPRRPLPVAILAWLGTALNHHGQGLGGRLLAQALRDCYEAGKTFAFVAIILDCVDDQAKSFYEHYGFAEIPGHPYRLFLSFQHLERIFASP